MNIDATDRRRFISAAIVTLLALPALWWVNNEESSAGPRVATVGVEVQAPGTVESVVVSDQDAPPVTVGVSNLPPRQDVPDREPVFLDGPAGNAAGTSNIAVQAPPDIEATVAVASYRGNLASIDTCLTKGIESGTLLTIVNLDTDRTTTCRARLAPRNQVQDLVLHRERFVDLADLTDAPIQVEIRR